MSSTAAGNGQPPTFRRTIAELVRARFPFLYVETSEEERLLAELCAVASDEQLIRRPRPVFVWNLLDGMAEVELDANRTISTKAEPGTRTARGGVDPSLALAALDRVHEHPDSALFVLCDFHWFFGAHNRLPDAQAIRRIRNLVPALSQGHQPKTVIFVAPALVLPDELQKDVYVVDFGLPSEEELGEALRRIIADQTPTARIKIDLQGDDEERLTKAALGLTLREAENAFARAMVHDDRLDASDVDVVMNEKRQAIRKTGILEFVESDLSMQADVGGLGNLREWLLKRNGAWLEEAQRHGIPPPKGILITGVPGCGKSLTAKCMSTLWELPLLRLDVGRIFGGLVGSSEQNMRNAIRTAEAISPAVLWIDEIEKGFSHGSGDLDSGVSRRVFGTFLTWMQDKEKLVFVIATANAIDSLPPEFLRKGRFDEIFFVDLPTHAERVGIFEIHLRRRLAKSALGGELKLTPELLGDLAHRSEGYSGAEIEQIVISALYEGFAEGRAVSQLDLQRSIETMVPLARTQAEQIRTMRAWATERAVVATSAEDRVGYEHGPAEDVLATRGGRTIDF